MAKPSSVPRLKEPHIAHAFVCEKVMIERDGVPSYVRAVDVISLVTPEDPEAGSLVPLNASLVVAIRPDERHRTRELTLRIERVDPSGKKRKVFFTAPVTLPDKEDACNTLAINIFMEWDGEGLYWFDIFFGERKVARVPLTLKIVRPPKAT